MDYTGKLIKHTDSYALFKNENGIKKFDDKELLSKIKNIPVGNDVNIIISTQTEKEIQKTVKTTVVDKIISSIEQLQAFKINDNTKLAEVIKNEEVKTINNKALYRIVFKNFETRKNEVIFSNTPIKCNPGDYMTFTMESWNKYTTQYNNKLKELINSLKPDHDTIYGKILSFGQRDIRGKLIDYIEIQTPSGTIKKYGQELIKNIHENNFKVGDDIKIFKQNNLIIKKQLYRTFEHINTSKAYLGRSH